MPSEEPAPQADEEAFAAASRGDRRTALTLLMQAHGDAVYRFCLRTLGDEVLAEDAHQQVFVDAWTDLARFSGRSTLRTWLFGIAVHRCQDATRRVRRLAARFEAVPSPPEAADPAEAPDEKMVRDAIERGLKACIGTLAPSTRTAVSLRYGEGFSYEQMAQICREKAGTLQARVARALPVLRRCLEEAGIWR